MSDTMVLIVAAAAAIFLFLALWKVIKTIVLAAVFAVVAAGALYILLPRLEDQKGFAGDAARKTQKLIKKVESQAPELSDKVKAGTDSAKKLLESATEKAKTLMSDAEKAAENVKALGKKTKAAADALAEE